jgi:flagellar protein FliT
MEQYKYMSASDETSSHSTRLPKDASQVAGYQVITNYESLSAITEQMREAAVLGEWDQLIGLEQQCRLHVAAMKPVDASAVLDEPSRQRKAQLIKNILTHDADIRSRTQEWMGQLQRIMQSNHQAQRLHQAYGT